MNEPYIVKYNMRFYYIQFHSKYHYLKFTSLTNKDCIFNINILSFKHFAVFGLNELVLKFFNGTSFSIYFTEGYDRTKFYHEVYPDYLEFPSNQPKITIITKLIDECDGFHHFLYTYTKQYLSTLGMYYNHQLYDYLSDPFIIDKEFYYAQSYLIERVYEVLFNTLQLDILYKPYRERIQIIHYRRESIKKKHKENKIKKSLTTFTENNLILLTDYEGNEINLKLADYMKEHRKTIQEKNVQRNNTFYKEFTKQKISFPKASNIHLSIINNYLFSKETLTMDILDNGEVNINATNPKDNIHFNMNHIAYMNDSSKETQLIIHLQNQKNINLEFTSVFYKYVFKSITYNYMLAKDEKKYFDNKMEFTFNCITWNIAGIDVPSDLGTVFNINKFEDVDFLALGVQECSVFKSNSWQNNYKILFAHYDFECVDSIKMLQMFLMVFVKKGLRKYISNVYVNIEAMGFGNIIGNKGCMIISFEFIGYLFAILNCHLAPSTYRIIERHEMVKNGIKTFRIGNKQIDLDVLADYTIWGGDMNYRVDFSYDDTIQFLKDGKINELLTKDQLNKERLKNGIFSLYYEPEIIFRPTYRRLINGATEHSTLQQIEDRLNYSNKKRQSPSWCDRVLIRSTRKVDYLTYTSLHDISHSDHYPVENRFIIHLTIPSITNDSLQKSDGYFKFTEITLLYSHFADILSNRTIQFPFYISLKIYHPLIDKQKQTKRIKISNTDDLNVIVFEAIVLEIMPQLLFCYPHGKALNIFFIVQIQYAKELPIEIGYTKYCLEDVDKSKALENITEHKCLLTLSYLTKIMGSLSFKAKYEF